MENYCKLLKKPALIFDVPFFVLNSARTVEQEQRSDLLYMETWCHISWIDDDSSYIAGEESLAVSPIPASFLWSWGHCVVLCCLPSSSSLLLVPPCSRPPGAKESLQAHDHGAGPQLSTQAASDIILCQGCVCVFQCYLFTPTFILWRSSNCDHALVLALQMSVLYLKDLSEFDCFGLIKMLNYDD